MEISDLINTDTVKLTLVPAIVVALVLFFWFRRSTPKAPMRGREGARGRNESGDPSLDEPDQWELGEVRVIRDGERHQPALRTSPGEVLDPLSDGMETEFQGRHASVPAGDEDERTQSRPAAEPAAERDVRPKRTSPQSPVRPAQLAAESQSSQPGERSRAAEQPVPDARQMGAGLMLVLNVVGNGRPLRGAPILKAVTGAGLTYGKMGIFHYYSPARPGRQPLFSLANMVEPGSFNLATMDELSTPGLTLFANVVNPEDGVSTFNAMLETARKLADGLHCTVCDERRSTLSRQGVEHIHGRIQDFQRRSRLAHAANA